MVKDLIINEYISKEELDSLTKVSDTNKIIKNIKNALIAYPLELYEHEWKKDRYSKEKINYDDIEIHVSNQFTKESLDELIAWYKFKKQ